MKKAWLTVALILTFLAGTALAAGPSFQEMDTDKDGKLSRQEVDAAAEKVFQEADKDRDGYLSEQEFKAIQGARSKYRDLDRNKDGKLSMDELRKSADRKFDYLDRSKDGSLDDLECGVRRTPRVSPLFRVYF
ncbi:MAG: EF-hand domain-containing protein [Syntrophales bacterium]